MWASVTFMPKNKTNQSTYWASVESTRSVLRVRPELNLWVDYTLFKENGKEMWARVTFIVTSQTNARTGIQLSQQGKFPEFARNWPRELIIIWSNRMMRKCEQGWHSCQQDKASHVQSHIAFNDVSSPSSLGMVPESRFSSVQIEWQGNVSKRDIHTKKTEPIHVQSHSAVNEVSSPRSLGIEPVSWLRPDRTEWKGNVSTRDIYTNKKSQSTYGATAQSTRWVLRVRSELYPWVH
jgi:hypothetical protein